MSGEPRTGQGATDSDDELDVTIAVPAVEDVTIAVAAVDSDATVGVSRTPSGGAHARAAGRAMRPAAVGAPVEEPESISPELAKLLFKHPLDANRRAPRAPFAPDESSLPRGGVRSGIPVAYGARVEGLAAPAATLGLEQTIGEPPAGYDVAAVERSGLTSLAGLNRRFGLIAWAGAAVVPLVVGVGLWWVITQLLRS